MKFRFKLSLIDVKSIDMRESLYAGGVVCHNLLATRGTFYQEMMEDYDLTFDQCMHLLDKIHDFFQKYPGGVFDFRPYETADAYLENNLGDVVRHD